MHSEYGGKRDIGVLQTNIGTITWLSESEPGMEEEQKEEMHLWDISKSFPFARHCIHEASTKLMRTL